MIGRFSRSMIGVSLAVAALSGSHAFANPSTAPCAPPAAAGFRSISKFEMELLIRDIADSNPKALERFESDPDARKSQLKNLSELLAFASEAVKEGLASTAVNCQELLNIRDETEASAHDNRINKGKPAKGPFAYITAERIDGFWGKGSGPKPADAILKDRESRFQNFLATKKAILARENPRVTDDAIGEAEIAMARDFFAKVQLYAADYRQSSKVLPPAVRGQVALQVKLQQAQYLARLYSSSAAEKMAATDAEVDSFLAAHPEMSSEAKRAKAEQILQRAKGGEDFAKLANEFTQDPGNKDANGVKHGGLYSGVGRGQFVAPFEKAALAMEAGQIFPSLVESDFGFHIIKLERKDASEGGTYDARHILISTTVPDPNNPGGREMPAREYARSQIESEKERKLIDGIVAANGITVPADFEVPTAAAPKAETPAKRTVTRPARKRT